MSNQSRFTSPESQIHPICLCLHLPSTMQVYYFVGTIAVSYSFAFVLAVCVEYPTMNLEKLLFKAARRWHDYTNGNARDWCYFFQRPTPPQHFYRSSQMCERANLLTVSTQGTIVWNDFSLVPGLIRCGRWSAWERGWSDFSRFSISFVNTNIFLYIFPG